MATSVNSPPRAAPVGRGDNALGLEHHPSASAISSLSSAKRRRVRPGRCFFITIDLDQYYESVRQDFISGFDQLVSFCVAVEESRSSKRVSYHMHAYLEFLDKCYLSDIKEYIECMYPGLRYDCQSCKSTKSVLKYITKEDRHPFYNVKVSLLHFNYRAYFWAVNTPQFSCADPFVQEHRFCYKFLERMFHDVKASLVKPCKLRFFDIAYCNWTLEVCMWWNGFLKTVGIRKKQLYLYGSTKLGKSTYVEKMIGKSNMDCVYFPGVGKFFMQGYRPGFHKIIIFEEFDIKYFCQSMLKRLLEGRKYSYPVKCGLDLNIVHTGPIIFVSNYVYDDCMDDALKSRFLFVSAEVPYWEALEACIPKEETDVCEDEESISISSDEEDDGSASASAIRVQESQHSQNACFETSISNYC